MMSFDNHIDLWYNTHVSNGRGVPFPISKLGYGSSASFFYCREVICIIALMVGIINGCTGQ